jgi:hypothetical protein
MHVYVHDNSRCELIPQGQTGGLTIFGDHANSDVEIRHLEKAQRLKLRSSSLVPCWQP